MSRFSVLFALGVVALGARPGTAGSSKRQSGVVAPSTVDDCTYFTDYPSDDFPDQGDTCTAIADYWGISLDQFVSYNPVVGSASNCNLQSGNSYCVEENYGQGPATTSTPPSSSPSPTGNNAPSPTQSGLIDSCTNFYKVKSGDYCQAIVDSYGTFTLQSFYQWNPSVNDDCSGLKPDFYVCVGVPGTPTTAAPTSSPTSSGPQPEQTGITDNCKAYYKVQSGDGCQAIVDMYGTFTLQDFYSWNPAVGSNCEHLFVGYYVCVGVTNTPTQRPSTTTTAAPTGPSPTQSGIESDCTKYYKAVEGDTCDVIANEKFGTFSIPSFIRWNPAVMSDCSKLFLGYYYCVAVPGTPTSRTHTTTASPTTSSGPSPTQSGIVDNCTQYYKAVSGDTCEVIANDEFGTFSVQDFVRWNPAVGSDCIHLFLGYYYCVAVPGTPTSRTRTTSASPTPTAKGPQPQQPGIVNNCNKYYKVRSGDSCYTIEQSKGVSDTQFFRWNTDFIHRLFSLAFPCEPSFENMPARMPASIPVSLHANSCIRAGHFDFAFDSANNVASQRAWGSFSSLLHIRIAMIMPSCCSGSRHVNSACYTPRICLPHAHAQNAVASCIYMTSSTKMSCHFGSHTSARNDPIDERTARPYGQLPSEVYLMRHWDSTSDLSPTDQRQALVRKFLELGVQGRKAYDGEYFDDPSWQNPSPPTQEQISTILAPWRPARLRAVASNLDVGIWLRLDWSDDAASARVQTEGLEQAREFQSESFIIDENELCPYTTDECTRILDILPELVTAHDNTCNDELLEQEKQEWQHADDRDKEGQEFHVQNESVVCTLVVEDKLTYEEPERGQVASGEEQEDDDDGDDDDRGRVLQLLLDQRGYVVRSMRVDRDAAMMIWSDWSVSTRSVFGVMTDGNIGKEYRAGGLTIRDFQPTLACRLQYQRQFLRSRGGVGTVEKLLVDCVLRPKFAATIKGLVVADVYDSAEEQNASLTLHRYLRRKTNFIGTFSASPFHSTTVVTLGHLRLHLTSCYDRQTLTAAREVSDARIAFADVVIKELRVQQVVTILLLLNEHIDLI
nr:lysm domain-containing protein [Quercus suber]